MSMTIKTAQHPDGVHSIQFRGQYHQYVDNYGSKYISGTYFFKPYAPKFDAPAIAERCSKGPNPKYSGRDPQEIMAEWSAEGKRGTDEGDNVHLYAENWPATDGNPDVAPISERCAALFQQVDAVFFDLILNHGYQVIGSEMIIFSPELLIAGTIDLLLLNPAINQIIIADWKQNKASLTTTNNFQKLLPPLEHLQDTEINKYGLQLSIYEYILKREGYFPGVTDYTRQLIHLYPDRFEYIYPDYYEYEIKEILQCRRTTTP
jgi:hypothetical protein